jgi:uncharacterized protein YndB with AHSA1/START domain
MTVTEQSFAIPASDLFAILVDPDTYPRWLVGTKKIRSVDAGWPSPGSSFAHTVGFGPLAIPDRTTVREIEAPNVLELLVRARPLIEAVVRFEVAATTTGSRLRMTETPVGIHKVIAPVVAPLIRARNERSMDRLRAVSDAMHIYRHWQKRKQVAASYDSWWLESGGQLAADGMFDLPPTFIMRDISTIKVNKRQLYRRRYQMFTDITTQLERAFAGKPSPASG